MNKKNYWVVCEFYWPVLNSTGQIITRIVDALSLNVNVNVLTVGNEAADERNKNIKTYRVKESKGDKNNLKQRFIKLIMTSLRLFYQAIRKIKNGDTVVAVTNPAFFLILIALLRSIRKFNFILIVQDVFPENASVIGLIKTDSLKYKLSKQIFNWAYGKADKLITNGCDMKATVQSKVNCAEKVIRLSDFANTNAIYPTEKNKNKILLDNNLTDCFVLLFTGNIGRMQDIPNILKAAELLKSNSDIKFLFIGDGALGNEVDTYISNGGTNVIHLPNMSSDEAIHFLNAGDVGIASLIHNIMGVGVPSKSYAYMAAGKPILAVMDKETEIARLVNTYDVGWNVEAGNPQKLVDTILYLKDNQLDIKKASKKAYNLSQTEYSEDVIIRKYIDVIL
ncbi:MAG: glycosyltransferase family 4 protein [Phocaeicola sp.]